MLEDACQFKKYPMGLPDRKAVPWDGALSGSRVGARVARINGIADVRIPVSDPSRRARVHTPMPTAMVQLSDRLESAPRSLHLSVEHYPSVW